MISTDLHVAGVLGSTSHASRSSVLLFRVELCCRQQPSFVKDLLRIAHVWYYDRARDTFLWPKL